MDGKQMRELARLPARELQGEIDRLDGRSRRVSLSRGVAYHVRMVKAALTHALERDAHIAQRQDVEHHERLRRNDPLRDKPHMGLAKYLQYPPSLSGIVATLLVHRPDSSQVSKIRVSVLPHAVQSYSNLGPLNGVIFDSIEDATRAVESAYFLSLPPGTILDENFRTGRRIAISRDSRGGVCFLSQEYDGNLNPYHDRGSFPHYVDALRDFASSYF